MPRLWLTTLGVLLLLVAAPARAATLTRYTVESFAVVEEEVARGLANTVKAHGHTPRIVKHTGAGATTFVVVAGSFTDQGQALQLQGLLNRQKFLFVITSVEVEAPPLLLLSVDMQDEDMASGAGPGDRLVFTFNSPVRLRPGQQRQGALDDLLASMGSFSQMPVQAANAALYERGERLVLVLGGMVRQTDTPGGVFTPNPAFVTGPEGQGIETDAPVPVTGTFDNLRPPQLKTVKLTDGDGRTGPGPGDTLTFVFNKPVSVNIPGKKPPETLRQWLALLGGFSPPASLDAARATLLQQGRELVLRLEAPATGSLNPGVTFTPGPAVVDLSDPTRPAQEKPAPLTGTFNDAQAPRLVTVVLQDNAGKPGPQAGDTLALQFNETLLGDTLKNKKTSGPLRAVLAQFVKLPPAFTLQATQSRVALAGDTVLVTLAGQVSGAVAASHLAPVAGGVRDESGNPLRDTTPVVVKGTFHDQIAPRLVKVQLADTGRNPGPGPGDEITFVFSEPVKLTGGAKQGPCPALLAQVASLSDNPLTAGQCSLGVSGATVVLRLGAGAATASGDSPGGLARPGAGVKDLSGNLPTPGEAKVTGTLNDTTAPRLALVVLVDHDQHQGFGPGDQIKFQFSEAIGGELTRQRFGGEMNLETALGNLGAFATQTDTARANVRPLVKGDWLVLTHVGGEVTPALSGPFTPRAGGVSDTSGNALVAVGPVAVTGTVNDRAAPRLVRVELQNRDGAAGLGPGDGLALVYNEPVSLPVMPPKGLPVMNLLRGLGTFEGGAEIAVAQSELVTSASKLVFNFLSAGSFSDPKNKFSASQPPRRFTPKPGVVRDAAGNVLQSTAPVPVGGHFGDTVAPVLLKITLKGADGGQGPGPGDRLVFHFSEPVKPTNMAPGGEGPCAALQLALAVFEQGNLTAGQCRWAAQGSDLVITLGPGATTQNGNAPGGAITAAPGLRDGAGNPVSTTGAVFAGTLDDSTPPRLIKVQLADADSTQGFGPGDTMTFVFSEPVAAEGKWPAQATLKAALEPLGQFATETGTDRVTVAIKTAGERVAFAHSGGEPVAGVVSGSFLPRSGAVADPAGNALKDTKPVAPTGTFNDASPPRLLRVLLSDGDGTAAIGPGDSLTFVFNEPPHWVTPPPPRGAPAQVLLRGLGQFEAGAALSANAAELALSGSTAVLTVLSAGRLEATDKKITPLDPPRRFSPLPGVVRDAVGNVSQQSASVPVEGNLADSKPPVLEKVFLRDGDRQRGVGPGDRIVLRFTEPVRLVLPQNKLNWAQFNRYIGKFDKSGPLEGTVELAPRGNDIVATFVDQPTMAEGPQGDFTPIRATFADAARNLLLVEGAVPVEGSFDDQAAPRLKTVTLLDGNQRPDFGKGDAMLLEYTEALAGSQSRAIARTATFGEILALVGELPGLSARALGAKAQALVQRNEVYVLVQEDTAEVVENPKTFTPKSGSVDDAAGNPLVDVRPVDVKGSFKDAVAPRLKRVVLQDKDGRFGPGPGDLVFLDFTEEVVWLTTPPAEGAVKDVLKPVGYFSTPNGFEQAVVKAEKSPLGLKLTVVSAPPGAQAPRGRFTLRGGVVKDTADNVAEEGSEALITGDYARDVPPVLVSVRYQDLDQNGLITKNDRLLFEYSKPMDPTNLVKVGELTRLLAQLGETRLNRGFNAGECWLSVQGKTVVILIGGKLYGESSLFNTFESKSDVLRDADRNPLTATRPQDVLVQSTQRAAPVRAPDTTPRVVALVATHDTQAMAAQLQDQLLAREIPSLIRSRTEKGRTLYLVIVPLPEDLVRRNDMLDQIGSMGHQPTLVLVSNRYVAP